MTSQRTAVRRSVLFALGFALLVHDLRAQEPIARPVGAIVATLADSIGRGSTLRVLADGRVLINDPVARHIVFVDANLAHPLVVADTTGATSKAYGGGLVGLLPFNGDSSLTVDRLTGALVVISPAGSIARIIPRPRATTATAMAFEDPAAFDHASGLLSRAPAPFYLGLLSPDFVGDTLMIGPDSIAILRQDITTRRIDTLVSLKAARNRQAVSRTAPGRGSGRPAFNPMPAADDWAVLNDGTVAIVRIADYHIDWVRPDKHIVSGPKIATRLIPLSAERKAAIVELARATMSRTGALPQAIVQPSDLPDFIPPFTSGFARADAESNVWVRQNQIGVIYDVVGRDGKLADRVTLSDWGLAGFAPGAVYLTRGSGRMLQLVKAALR